METFFCITGQVHQLPMDSFHKGSLARNFHALYVVDLNILSYNIRQNDTTYVSVSVSVVHIALFSSS